MTLSEAWPRVYEGAEGIDDIPKEERTAILILRMFIERGGFDGWWDDCSEEDQEEMFEQMKKIISEQKGAK